MRGLCLGSSRACRTWVRQNSSIVPRGFQAEGSNVLPPDLSRIAQLNRESAQRCREAAEEARSAVRQIAQIDNTERRVHLASLKDEYKMEAWLQDIKADFFHDLASLVEPMSVDTIDLAESKIEDVGPVLDHGEDATAKSAMVVSINTARLMRQRRALKGF